MKGSLKFIINTFMVLIIILSTSPYVLADNSSAGGKAISLKIEWIDDTPATRPESMTIELYRHYDDEDIPMDSKVVSDKDSSSANTWNISFTYYYGPVWEYAFKIISTKPQTALYSYQLKESGNGTDQYTFAFYHGQGNMDMQIKTVWEDDNNSKNTRPESFSADLINISTGECERTVTLEADNQNWSATVMGLSGKASDYYVVVNDLPADYSNVVTRGEDSNTYVCTNTYDAVETVEVSTDQTLSGALDRVVGTLNIENLERSNSILRGILVTVLLLALVTLAGFYFYGKKTKRP